MRTITLEEHFATGAFLKASNTIADSGPQKEIQTRLLDLGEGRIAAMDAGGVDLQVLSLTANGLDALSPEVATPLVREINDELAEAIRRYPDRFAGFATLGLKQPEAAATELERCVNQLGFKGALLDGTTDGEFLDQPKFLPVFEAASSLNVPLYLHPAPPPKSVMDAYYSGLPGDAGFLLSIAGWGWHAENGLHTLRLIVSGLFERLPNLQLIIGHMGEGVPNALARSSKVLTQTMKNYPLTVAEYFNRNVFVTTSGYFTKPPFQCALDVVGIDRLMYSVDYPYSPNEAGKQFLNSLDLRQDDLEKLAHGNAERVLRL